MAKKTAKISENELCKKVDCSAVRTLSYKKKEEANIVNPSVSILSSNDCQRVGLAAGKMTAKNVDPSGSFGDMESPTDVDVDANISPQSLRSYQDYQRPKIVATTNETAKDRSHARHHRWCCLGQHLWCRCPGHHQWCQTSYKASPPIRGLRL